MTDLGDISHYHGMKIDVNLNKKTISLQKSMDLKKLRSRYSISNFKPVKIPIILGVANSLTSYKDIAKKSIIA